MSSRPATIRSAVVFPHPDGPTRTMNSPSATSRSSSWIASKSFGWILFTCSRLIVAISSHPRSREPAPGSALDGAGDESAHVEALERDVDDDAGDHRDHGPRDEDSVVDLTVGVARLDVHERDGERVDRVVRRERERTEEFGPREEKSVQDGRRDARDDEGPKHVRERRHDRGAVALR